MAGVPALPKRFKGYYRRAGYYGRATLQGEKKFFEVRRAENTPATTGTIFDDSLNEVAQGAAENERVGRKMTITDLLIHFQLRVTTSTTASAVADSFRYIVYVDKQANGAAATPGQILEAGGAGVDIRCFRLLENASRFRILYDKIHSIESNGGGVGAADNSVPKARHFSVYKKLKLPIEFSGATGAIAEIRSNNIGVLILSTNAAANCVTGYTARIRYTDI
jgi:hypothetical protein